MWTMCGHCGHMAQIRRCKVKSYHDRLIEYEIWKNILIQTCKDSDELCEKLKELARKLKI